MADGGAVAVPHASAVWTSMGEAVVHAFHLRADRAAIEAEDPKDGAQRSGSIELRQRRVQFEIVFGRAEDRRAATFQPGMSDEVIPIVLRNANA